MATAIVPAVALTACSDDDAPAGGSGEGDGSGKFVFATTVAGSAGSQSVLLTGPSLDEGSLDVYNGLVNDGATQWVSVSYTTLTLPTILRV